MYRCHGCGEWIEKTHLFCPDCRIPVGPDSERRPMSDVLFIAVLAGGILAVLILAAWLAS